jgi:molybdopterin synthase catalytic subunit
MSERKVKSIFMQGPISPSFMAESLAHHSRKKNIGAHSMFMGQVRNDQIDGQEVVGIDYTSYEEMANETMHQIREDIFAKYALTCLHVYHSLGHVAAGEISLFVFTSSAHRAAAIQACSELVERIKKEVPIWGKEIFDDGTGKWKQSTP